MHHSTWLITWLMTPHPTRGKGVQAVTTHCELQRSKRARVSPFLLVPRSFGRKGMWAWFSTCSKSWSMMMIFSQFLTAWMILVGISEAMDYTAVVLNCTSLELFVQELPISCVESLSIALLSTSTREQYSLSLCRIMSWNTNVGISFFFCLAQLIVCKCDAFFSFKSWLSGWVWYHEDQMGFVARSSGTMWREYLCLLMYCQEVLMSRMSRW